jgi:hypothetical protein
VTYFFVVLLIVPLYLHLREVDENLFQCCLRKLKLAYQLLS